MSDETRYFDVTFEQRAPRVVVARVAPYDTPANVAGKFIETFAPRVFAKSITERAKAIPLMVNHQHAPAAVAKAVSWEEREDGLVGEFAFDTGAEAVEVLRKVEGDLLTGMSVGFRPVKSDWDTTSGPLPMVTRREGVLREVSLCGVGVYEDAGVLLVRSAGNPDDPATRVTPRLDQERQMWDDLRRGKPPLTM